MKEPMKKEARCEWAGEDAVMQRYHDEEWGRPLRSDKKIFEFLVLESFQAGLSWRTILYKRKNFEKAFANFDPNKVAKFNAVKIKSLLKDAGIIRNRAKIEAAVNNAKRFLEVQKEFGTFSKYMWSFVGGKPIVHTIRSRRDYRTTSPEAEAWAKDLKTRGFKFLGPTTLYAHMQAVGMFNDHMQKCFRKNLL
jgi:DNA-3-methyladenine glycosylase I